MADKVSSKAVGEAAGHFVTDLAQFWANRQTRLYEIGLAKLIEEFSVIEEKANTHYEYLKSALHGNEEVIYHLNQFDDERLHLQTMSNSLFYQQGFSDALRVLFTSLITG
jgi:hypothetical protein